MRQFIPNLNLSYGYVFCVSTCNHPYINHFFQVREPLLIWIYYLKRRNPSLNEYGLQQRRYAIFLGNMYLWLNINYIK